MDYKDYYAALGVSRNTSQDDIQKAYRKLARKFHPDVNRSPGAEDRFKQITEAYEVLKDDKKRSTYDRFGTAWKSRGGPPPGFEGFDPFEGGFRVNFGGRGPGGGAGASGFSSFFDMLFGNRGGGAGSPFGGADPFVEFGGSPPGGSPPGGSSPGGSPPGASSPFGSGPGVRVQGQEQIVKLALTLEEAAQGGLRDVTVTDMLGRSKTYNVNLPAGIRPGQKIRLPGRGRSGGRGPTGDLYLEVQVKTHDRFRLDGRDLRTDIRVSPWEAALGTNVTLKTLNGSVKVRIPPGSSTGRKIRLRGKGFPARDGEGDLYAEIRVMVPEKLTPRERELFEELARESSFKA